MFVLNDPALFPQMIALDNLFSIANLNFAYTHRYGHWKNIHLIYDDLWRSEVGIRCCDKLLARFDKKIILKCQNIWSESIAWFKKEGRQDEGEILIKEIGVEKYLKRIMSIVMNFIFCMV